MTTSRSFAGVALATLLSSPRALADGPAPTDAAPAGGEPTPPEAPRVRPDPGRFSGTRVVVESLDRVVISGAVRRGLVV